MISISSTGTMFADSYPIKDKLNPGGIKMAKSNVGTKQDNVETSNSYFALKSKNEVYFQMASIFKHAANDENDLAEKIFSGVLTGNRSEIFLENYM